MSLPTYQNISLHEYRNCALTEAALQFSAEYPVMLKINNTPYITIACSGTYLEEHVTGYLITEGIISAAGDIQNIEIDESNLTVNVLLAENARLSGKLEYVKTLSAAGGRSRKILPDAGLIRKNLPEVRPDIIIKCMAEFLTFSKERETTHGVHASAMYTLKGERLVFFDEIGRHNAIDKVIGYASINNISLEDKMICTTGRVSSEIALKFIHASAPVLITRASPTTYSVKLLRDYNILAVIRAVNGGFYVVNGKERIVLKK